MNNELAVPDFNCESFAHETLCFSNVKIELNIAKSSYLTETNQTQHRKHKN